MNERIQIKALKSYARKEMGKRYPLLQKLILSMPDSIEASAYIGWVGALLKLMGLCETDNGAVGG